MKRNFWSKTLVLVLTLSLLFGLATIGSASTRYQAKEQIAEIFGEYDFQSEELVTVIVELKEPSVVEARHSGRKQSKERVKNFGRSVIAQLESKVNGVLVNREFQYLFAGFSVELPQNQIPVLLTLDGVRAVYPNVHYQPTQVGGAIKIPWESITPNMVDSAPFIGSNEAWEQGFTGKGITVAIIDTGVDYTHPDLAHAFGEYKGWDFVDNDADPQEGPGQSHGTHVAGTVAANGLIRGVAPEVRLLAYRVLGPTGGTTQDVLAGIELAVQDGADIMNLSLGNTLNAPDWATSIALDWAMAEGVIAVTSNGNSGPNNWTVGSPGSSRRAISVGATQLPFNVYNSKVNVGEVKISSAEVMGFPNDDAILRLDGQELEFVYVGLGLPQDFDGINVEGRVALISRGVIPFIEKSDNAKANGAIANIIFNNVPGQIEHFVAGISLPTIKVSNEDGKKLLAALEAGDNKVSFGIEKAYEVGETVADFSSRGPAATTWMIKPDVVAPGVNIISTVPGGYARKQGTSMASPHVAGAAAILLQKNPTWSVDQVKAALMNTAETLINPFTGKTYPHNTQGAGSIRINNALNTETLIIPGSHSFGKFVKNNGKQVERQSFTIENLSNIRKTYSFSMEIKENPDGIRVNISNNLRINAGRTQQVNMNVQVDTRKLAPGYYEGTIRVSDGKNTFEIPTILFVGEPDYPRITHGGIVPWGDEFIVWAFLPGGADLMEVWIFRDEPWAYIGDGLVLEKIEAGYHEFIWDGKVNGNNLSPGVYHAFIYAEKAGVGQWIYGGAFRIE